MPRFLSIAENSLSTQRTAHGVLSGTAYKRLVVSTLPGVRADGSLPEGLAAQTEQAFDNLATLVDNAGLMADDLVRVAAFVAMPGSEGLVLSVATSRLGPIRPSLSVRHVNSLTQTNCLIEIDAEAVRES